MRGSLRYRLRREFARRLAHLWPRLPPLALQGLGAGAVGLAGYLCLTQAPDLLTRVDGWVAAHRQHRAGDAAGRLFDELVRESRAIGVDARSGRLRLSVDCGAEVAGAVPPRSAADAARIDRLCRSDVGQTILNEIADWNRSLDMLAIRDDAGHRGLRFAAAPRRGAREAGAAGLCEDGTTPPTVIPAGCHRNHWELSAGLQDDALTLDAAMWGAPAGEIFGFLARGQHPGFGDWLRVDAQAIGPRPAILSARVAALAKPTQIVVDVIAADPQFQIDGAAAGERSLLCHGARTQETCARLLAEHPLTPHGWRFRVDLPVGRDLVLSVRARPVAVSPVELADLKAIEANPRASGQTVALREDESVTLTRSIRLACQVFDQDEYEEGGIFRILRKTGRAQPAGPSSRRFCEPVWRSAVTVAARPPRPGVAVIRAIGGGRQAALTELQARAPDPEEPDDERDAGDRPSVTPTAAARELGLSPVVGLGESDRYSLLGQASRATPPGETRALEITIDPALQKLALGRLTAALDPKGAQAGLFAPVPAEARRAAVVILDAGRAGAPDGGYDNQTGRILAAATLPLLRPGLSQWDVLAANAYRPAEGPLAARGWSQNDKHFAPGSTLKSVVGLAAVDRAARGDETIARALGLERGSGGGPAPADYAAVFGRKYGYGWAATALTVPVGDGRDPDEHEIQNADGGRLCAAATPPCAPDGRLGLRGAMARSSNMWFARMALLLDEPKIMQETGAGPPRELKRASERELTLARVLRRVWPAGGVELAPGFAQRFGRTPIAGSRSRATPIRLDATLPDRPRRLALALNGIGQATQATPTAIASIMASIATGRIVRPRLTPEAEAAPTAAADAAGAEEARPGDPILAEDAPGDGGKLDPGRAAELLAGLRGALHAVVTAGGTAAAAFQNADYLGRLYGKTGTAESGDTKESTNSVWFVGWVDGVGGAYGAERRIAFACLVTHMTRRAGGGGFCAPLIAGILGELQTRALRWDEAKG